MFDPQFGTGPENALAALNDTANALAGIGSFEGILELAPQLALWVLPTATRAELRVTCPRRTRPTTAHAVAGPGFGLTVVPSRAVTLSLPIALDEDTPPGELILYPGSSDGFDRAATLTAVLLTSQIRDALERAAAWETTAQLQVAVVTNRDIGVAVGIIMATQQLSPEQAFEVLRTTSQNTNRKLADVAESVRKPYGGEHLSSRQGLRLLPGRPGDPERPGRRERLGAS